ncbi:MAG TPA: TolC family protein, partial [Usitatibacter sp.]|nr:TolC family protein [Usitatibacter sp.]
GIGATRERATAASELPDPVVTLAIDNVPIEKEQAVEEPGHPLAKAWASGNRFSTTRDNMTMRRIGVMQEWTRADKRELRAERYQLEARKAEAEVQASRAAIRRDTAIAWMDAWHAEAMAAAIAEQRVRGLQEVQLAEAEYRAGRGTQADLLMARSALAMLDDRAAELERKARVARSMLIRWIGPDGVRGLGRRPAFVGDHRDMHALDDGLESHPQMLVLDREKDIAAAEARLAGLASTPDITTELSYLKRGSQYGDMVTFEVRMPLPWDTGNRQDREVRARRALAEQAAALRDEALREHVAEVRNLFFEFDSNRARLTRYEREIVPLAAARAETTLAAYRGAKASANDVVVARRAELEARLQQLQLEADTARLWARLNFLTGEDAQ